MDQVKFGQWLCNVVYGQYPNNRVAIALRDAEDGGPVATASVNLPDEELADDEICIKDYSENAGMLDAMVKAGIVSTPLRHVSSGFVDVPVCKLLKKPEPIENAKEA